MSDRGNINIEDRGWNDMRSILDKEMPEKKKKRRFGFWLFFGGSLFAVVFLLRVFAFPSILDHSETSISNNKLVVDKPENESENTFDYKTTSIAENNSVPDKITTETASLTDSKSSNISSNPTEKLNQPQLKQVSAKGMVSEDDLNKNISGIGETIKRSEITNSAQVNPSTYILDVQSISQSEPKPKTETEAENKPDDQIDLEKQLIKEEVVPDELEQSERLMLRPLLEFPFINPSFNLPEDKQLKLTNPIVVVDDPKIFVPYVFALGNYQSSINGYGYGLGAGLSYGNKDFQFYIEAGYNKSKFDDGGGNLDELAADSDVTIVEVDPEGELIFGSNTTSPLSSFDLRVTNFSLITRSTKEIKFDVGLRRKLFQKISLDVGLSYSKLVSATNKSLAIEYIGASDVPELFTNSTSVSSSELYNSGAYSSYDIVPHIGVEYSLLSNLHFGVRYNHGLRNLISRTELERISSISANESIYRRSIAAKVRFEF